MRFASPPACGAASAAGVPSGGCDAAVAGGAESRTTAAHAARRTANERRSARTRAMARFKSWGCTFMSPLRSNENENGFLTAEP